MPRGFVRTAELLSRDGLMAYDGAGCRDIPTLSGVLLGGAHLYPRQDDADEVRAASRIHTPRGAT